MPDRHIAIWTAVSSEEQAKRYSLDAQLKDCREFVASIPERYKEIGNVVAEISMADTRSIIEFSEACVLYPYSYGVLSSLIRHKKINVLVCVRRDRLGREESLVMTIEALCRKHGVKIVAIKSSIPSTLNPTDDEGSGYAVAVEAVAARIELRRFQDRRESGIIGRVADERLFPGQCPWGYSYLYSPTGEIEQIVLDSAIKAIVRYILVTLFTEQGLGGPAICDILNQQNMPSPKRRPWTRGGVRSIIERASRYAGWIEYNREGKAGKEYIRVKGNYETVITDAELAIITMEYEGRRYQKQRRHRLLSGIVFCEGCSQPMHYRRRPIVHNGQRTGSYVDYLACRNRECLAPAEIVETALITSLEESFALVARSTDETLIAFASQKPVDIGPAQERLDGLLTELDQVSDERKRAIVAFINLKAITETEFAEQMKRLDSRLASLTSSIEKAKQWVTEEQEKNESMLRLRELRSTGIATFAKRHADPGMVNQWLRSSVKVTVKKRRKNSRRRATVQFR